MWPAGSCSSWTLYLCCVSSVQLEGAAQTWRLCSSSTRRSGLRVSEPGCGEVRPGDLQRAESVPGSDGRDQEPETRSQTAGGQGFTAPGRAWHHIWSHNKVRKTSRELIIGHWLMYYWSISPSGRRLLCPTSSLISTLVNGWKSSWAGIKSATTNSCRGWDSNSWNN